MTVYLNHMIFRTLKDGTSLRRINMELRLPKLHFVHPSSFEAGKAMEFVACGSNLIQSNFRFLVSFAGKYLAYDLFAVSTCLGTKKHDSDNEHQLYKLRVPLTEPEIFGPAFIEVENEAGLSNFIPVLIGDREVCCEMKSIQRKFNELNFPPKPDIASERWLSEKCEASALTQMAFSDLVLDVAWLLKEPMMDSVEEILIPSQIQRINCLLNFLIQSESTIILKKLLLNLKIMTDKRGLNRPLSGTNFSDIRLFQKYMDNATDIVYKKHHRNACSRLLSECIVPERECCEAGLESDDMSQGFPLYQNKPGRGLGVLITSTAADTSVTLPLLDREVDMDVHVSKDGSTCSPLFSFTVMRPRPTILVVTIAAVCFGICAVCLHPEKFGNFTVTIRRCLFSKTSSWE